MQFVRSWIAAPRPSEQQICRIAKASGLVLGGLHLRDLSATELGVRGRRASPMQPGDTVPNRYRQWLAQARLVPCVRENRRFSRAKSDERRWLHGTKISL